MEHSCLFIHCYELDLVIFIFIKKILYLKIKELLSVSDTLCRIGHMTG